jgi:hypothetical protein
MTACSINLGKVVTKAKRLAERRRALREAREFGGACAEARGQ